MLQKWTWVNLKSTVWASCSALPIVHSPKTILLWNRLDTWFAVELGTNHCINSCTTAYNNWLCVLSFVLSCKFSVSLTLDQDLKSVQIVLLSVLSWARSMQKKSRGKNKQGEMEKNVVNVTEPWKAWPEVGMTLYTRFFSAVAAGINITYINPLLVQEISSPGISNHSTLNALWDTHSLSHTQTHMHAQILESKWEFWVVSVFCFVSLLLSLEAWLWMLLRDHPSTQVMCLCLKDLYQKLWKDINCIRQYYLSCVSLCLCVCFFVFFTDHHSVCLQAVGEKVQHD